MERSAKTGFSEAWQNTAEENDKRLINKRTVDLIAILNSDMPVDGINYYELLRRNVQDNPELKAVYRGAVKAGEVVVDAVKLYASMLSLGDKTGGISSYEEVIQQGSAKRIFEDITTKVLPTVIEQRQSQIKQRELGR